MKAFPWIEAMEFGFGILRLSSEQFWSMTPRELHAAYSANTKSARASLPIQRAELAHLMEKFPDKDSDNDRRK